MKTPEYRMSPELVNGFGRPVTGSFLAHAKLSKVEAAYLAADLYRGTRFVVRLTMLQCARLVHVSPAYAHAALRRPDVRWLVENGHLPLVMPRTTKSATPAPVETCDIIPDDFVGWDGGVLDLPEMRTW